MELNCKGYCQTGIDFLKKDKPIQSPEMSIRWLYDVDKNGFADHGWQCWKKAIAKSDYADDYGRKDFIRQMELIQQEGSCVYG